MPHHSRTLWPLATSFFSSSWSSRMDEFATSLFIITIFSESLLEVALYGLVVTLSAIIGGVFIGRVIDSHSRITVLRTSLVCQKLAIAGSALSLWTIQVFYGPETHPTETYALYGLSILFGILLKWSSIINTISIEKDWAVVIAHADPSTQRDINVVLRRVDLTCKIAAPFAVSIITTFLLVPQTMLVVASIGVALIPLEWSLVSHVYGLIQKPVEDDAPGNAIDDESVAILPNPDFGPEAAGGYGAVQDHDAAPFAPAPLKRGWLGDWIYFIRHPVFLSSLAISQLYFTVLSFGTTMVAYMLSQGYAPVTVALSRGLAVIMGLLATFLMPVIAKRIGNVNTGLWAIWTQAAFIGVALSSFVLDWWGFDSVVVGSLLIGGTALSRIGLWTFDLVQTQIMQEGVALADCGVMNGAQSSLQNMFDLLQFAATVYWSLPSQFYLTSFLSGASTLSAALLFSIYVWKENRRLRAI
ncbi:Ferroporti-1 [Polychytrium aggregatum]|uniref:Ferroporti-1 n=1 Tax=Polychytrium aggregatum TaxID=110093 RepID=UPI0022FEFE4D|nr:Ferroporti-1 [Polychytrium aggregatum]KAI9209440.1 Ferroporti-1 [Polychytrium aggregatum]